MKTIKHEIEIGLEHYNNSSPLMSVTTEECKWIKEYIHDIESSDSASDLFRYPFSEDFLKNYNYGFLDIVAMVNRLINAYSILSKEYEGDKHRNYFSDKVSKVKFHWLKVPVFLIK